MLSIQGTRQPEVPSADAGWRPDRCPGAALPPLQCPGLPGRRGAVCLGSETRGRTHTVTQGWPRLTRGLALGPQVPGQGCSSLSAVIPAAQLPGARLRVLCDPTASWARLGGRPARAGRAPSALLPDPRQGSGAGIQGDQVCPLSYGFSCLFQEAFQVAELAEQPRGCRRPQTLTASDGHSPIPRLRPLPLRPLLRQPHSTQKALLSTLSYISRL